MRIGDKIRYLREQRGLSQEQLAHMLTMPHWEIARWEDGEAAPDVDKVLRLSEIFEVSTDYLLKNAVESHSAPMPNRVVFNDRDDNDDDVRIDIGFGEVHFPRGIKRRKRRNNFILMNIYGIALVAYLIMGVGWGLWHPGWMIFLVAWAISDFSKSSFCIYSLAAIAFFVMGFGWSMWGVAWIVFPAAWLLSSLAGDYRRNSRRDRRDI